MVGPKSLEDGHRLNPSADDLAFCSIGAFRQTSLRASLAMLRQCFSSLSAMNQRTCLQQMNVETRIWLTGIAAFVRDAVVWRIEYL